MNNQSTKAFSAQLGIRPESIHARYSRFGSYFGIRPTKLINGRLLWPAEAVEKLKRHGKTL